MIKSINWATVSVTLGMAVLVLLMVLFAWSLGGYILSLLLPLSWLQGSIAFVISIILLHAYQFAFDTVKKLF